MKSWKKLLTIVFVALLAVGMSDLYGRGSRGGGSRSFSRPSSRSVPKSPSRTPSRTPSKGVSSKKPTTSSRATSPPKRTPEQQKKFEAATKNGTAYKSKSEAMSAFKKSNSSKYTSKYAKEPANRPNHIPQTTSVGGTNVNINYNASMRCYGYMHPSLGTWMMYDAMSDAVMMSALMSQNHYYYDPAPVGRPAAGAVIVHRTSAWSVIGFIVGAVVIGFFVIIFIKVLTS